MAQCHQTSWDLGFHGNLCWDYGRSAVLQDWDEKLRKGWLLQLSVGNFDVGPDVTQ